MAEEIKDSEIEVEKEEDDEEVTIKYDIASYPSDYTLSGYLDKWHDGDIVIPEYQREFVWTIKQSSLLIDSFLSGLPVPPVFFYIDDENKNLVIDGQQRILSVIYFLDGFFGNEDVHGKRKVFRLKLGESNKYNGKTFEDLTDSEQRKLKQSVMRAINIRQLHPIGESTSAYHIFERLNTGGTPLRAQEIRNCVFRGEFSNELKKLNKLQDWRKIVGKTNIDKHQKDIEFILRIFSLVKSSDKYEKPMKEFLNKSMKKHQLANTEKFSNFKDLFPKVCSLIYSELGEKPFHIRGPLNVSALDSVMSVLIEKFADVDKDNFHKNFKDLLQDPDFIEDTSINTTDTKTVHSRIAKVKDFLVK